MRKIAIATLTTALAAGACSPYDAVQPDDVTAGPVQVPGAYGESVAGHTAEYPDRWWKAFGDPDLDALMERVERDNLDLKQAWARLAQAEATAKSASAARLPPVDANASSSRARTWQQAPPTTPDGKPQEEAATGNRHSFGLGASYEIDVWGKAAAQARGAKYDRQATRFDVESLAMTLAAEVSEAWFGLVQSRAEKALLEKQIENARTLHELVQARFGQGMANAVDVFQARQQLQATESQLPPVLARIEVLEHQLAVLAGQVPAEGETLSGKAAALPDPATPPATGIPSDLLRKRPDVQSAQHRLAAADQRVAVAVADRYPQFRIQMTTGLSSGSFTGIIEKWVYSLTANLVAPLFDGGRRKAEIRKQKAVVQERLAALGQTFLVAMQEVEDALVSETRQRERVEGVRQQVAISERLVSESRVRYAQGLSDYLPVLNAVETLHRAQRELEAARLALVVHRIDLHRALGGDWTGEMQPPEPMPVRPEAVKPTPVAKETR
jgi:NodT family efflux transporter outer membrane factor (OMF) lipoprotein